MNDSMSPIVKSTRTGVQSVPGRGGSLVSIGFDWEVCIAPVALVALARLAVVQPAVPAPGLMELIFATSNDFHVQ